MNERTNEPMHKWTNAQNERMHEWANAQNKRMNDWTLNEQMNEWIFWDRPIDQMTASEIVRWLSPLKWNNR